MLVVGDVIQMTSGPAGRAIVTMAISRSSSSRWLRQEHVVVKSRAVVAALPLRVNVEERAHSADGETFGAELKNRSLIVPLHVTPLRA